MAAVITRCERNESASVPKKRKNIQPTTTTPCQQLLPSTLTPHLFFYGDALCPCALFRDKVSAYQLKFFLFFFFFRLILNKLIETLDLVQYFVTFFFLFKRKRKWNKINKYTVVEKNVLCWWVGLLSSLPPHSRLAHYIACPWNSRSKYEYRIVWKLLWCVSFFFSFSPHSPFPKHIFKW